MISMVETYKAKCRACDVEYFLKYGSKNEQIIYETFSCQNCNNLFSLSNNKEKFSCPSCGNEKLIRYNMNKMENMSYYRKMYEEKLLSIEKYEETISFWKTIRSDECPNCGKHELEWIPIKG